MEKEKETRTGTSMLSRQVSLWHNRDYLLLWSGQTISSIGSGITQLAYPLLALALTGSPVQAGITSALGVLSFVLLGLPAGALVDRWDRKWVMIICDTGRALSLASIPVASALAHLTIIQLYITSSIEGILFVFFNIAQVASIPRVVDKEQVPNAMAQSQATIGITSLISPPLSGILYAANHVFPFLTDAISYAVSVVSLFFIRVPFQEERKTAPRALRAEIVEGLNWLWHHPLIRSMALLSGGINLVLPGSTLIVIVQAQRMHASSTTIGLIFGIVGVGTMVGSFLAPIVQRRYRFGAIVLSLSWLVALLWPLFIASPYPFALGAVLTGISLLGPIYNVVILSYRLALTPDKLQGRVNSVVRMIAVGVVPINYILTGVLLQSAGVVVTVLVFAAMLLGLAIMVTFNIHIRSAGSLAEAHRMAQGEVQEVTS